MLAICLCIPVVSSAQITTNCLDDLEICLTEEGCTATFLLPYPNWTTNCAQSDLVYTYSGSFGSGAIPPEGVLFTGIAIGDHNITISATDDCSNTGDCLWSVSVRDCHQSAPLCINGLIVELMANDPVTDTDGDGDPDLASIQVWATDFLTILAGDCTGPTRYSIHRSDQISNGTAIPNPDQDHLILTCDDIGLVNVRLYAWDNAFNPDAVQPDGTVGGSNYDWCETVIQVDNTFSFCDTSAMLVTGEIRTPWGALLPGVEVEISNGIQTYHTITAANGRYSMVLPDGVYTVRPLSPSFDHSNGVDISDLFLIRNHILEIVNLGNPYKMLAADVNMSGVITLFDLVLINRFTTGIDPDFLGDSWRYVDAAYQFPMPQNPFFEAVPDFVQVSEGNPEANFIAIKNGDVNWDLGTVTGVEGKVFLSPNGDCQIDVDNDVLEGWIVKAKFADENFYAYNLTNALGAFHLSLPPGEYLISLTPLNDNWNACQTEVPVLVGDTGYQIMNLSATSIYNCPVMTVDVGAPFLRRCFENQLTVNYTNNGSAIAEDAYIEVDFDDYLTVTESTQPWSSASDNTYTFPIGDVLPGQSGYFHITALVSCEATLGQTHCIEAHVYPDTICLPSEEIWDGSDLVLTSLCDTDTLRFFIENQGSDMEQSSPYYVVVDDLIMMTGEVELPSGGIEEIAREADGATLRLLVHQTPGHPGQSTPTLAVEGCGVNESGSFSTGYFTQFPEDEGDPAISIYCTENIGSFDPNDKQAFPKGVGEAHYLEPGQELEYLIRFQNTGSDTAFTIVIVDTLSASLDPATLQTGASSHPCIWQLRNDGVLTVSFNGIALPDSTTNEPASHGFVSFRIRQRDGLELPTVITNEAAIYFDFNELVITNEVMHTVDTNFLEMVTLDREVFKPVSSLRLSPNPLKAGATFRIAVEGVLSDQSQVVFYNSTGTAVATLRVQAGGVATLPAGLPAGWYLLEFRSNNHVIGRGKVVVGK